MGVISCEKHGRSFVIDACPHIEKAVNEQTSLPKVITARFHFGYLAGDETMPLKDAKNYCLECAKEFGFPAESGDLSEDEYETMCDKIHWKPICENCYQAVKQQSQQ